MALPESKNKDSTQDDGSQWPPLRRITFRFVSVYLVLYNLPFPLSSSIFTQYDDLWNHLAVLIGRHLLHRTPVIANGSGDTTAAWIRVMLYLAFAILATAIWTLKDRKRRHYGRLYEWLQVYIRFSLATTMIMYGSVKIWPSQFASPSLFRLMEPFGDASPMGLLWTFMGASPAYCTFCGMIEMIGGLLLTTRHTTLLGSLVCAGALANVVALNFCYDVPVKQYSIHLLLMAIFLAAPSFKRLTDFFIRGQAAAPAILRPLFQNRRQDRAARTLRTVFVTGYTALALLQAYQGSLQQRADTRVPLHGIWAVDDWNVGGVQHPPILTDAARWQRIVFDNPESTAIQSMPGSWQYCDAALNIPVHTLSITRDDTTKSFTLSYEQPAPGRLTLFGKMDGKQIRITLHREDTARFLLVRRGFHWINEYPYNR